MSEIITMHGIKFRRTGKCNRCGECEKKDCPHFKMVDGLATCDVQDKKEEICELCSNDESSIWWKKGKKITHIICKCLPSHPFLRVIMSGECGYKFEPLTKEDKIKYEKCKKVWRLP